MAGVGEHTMAPRPNNHHPNGNGVDHSHHRPKAPIPSLLRPLPPSPPPPPPYPLPPPPNHSNHHPPQNHFSDHHPPYHSSSSSFASFKGCCCCLFLLLIFLALLAVAVALVVVLVVKPKKPQFDLQQVGVSYILITQPDATPALPPTSPSAAYLTMNITMVFTAANPNKVGIRYGSPGFTVMYKGVPLGLATIPAFEQPAHSTRMVESRVAVSRVNVLQGDALDLVRDATMNDRVELRVVGDVGAKIQVIGLTSPKVQVSVDCAVVISPRRQSVTYKQCGVDGLNV